MPVVPLGRAFAQSPVAQMAFLAVVFWYGVCNGSKWICDREEASNVHLGAL